jgi:hypothetical protein
VTLVTSWSDYLMAATLPIMSSSTCTLLENFGNIRGPFVCGCDPLCAFLSSWPFQLACGDEASTFGTPSCIASYATYGSWICGTELVACSVCCFPYPLELSNLFLSRSSSIYQTSYDGVYSSSTVTGSISYFNVWISSTSTTIGVTFSLVSVA